MSLSLFAVRNQWHKNGNHLIIKESGGSPKSSIASLEKIATTPFESPGESSQTSFTT